MTRSNFDNPNFSLYSSITSTSFAVLVVGAALIALIASGDFMVVEVAWQSGVAIPLLCLGLFGSLACILML